MKTLLTFVFSFLFVFISFGQTIESRIAEIRKEYYSINSSKLKKDSIEISDETTEGGQVDFYRDASDNLRKIVASYYGENGKLVNEYYISNGNLIFCFTQRFDYNQAITAEGTSKTTVSEYRYYFGTNKKLIRIIDKDKKVIQDNPSLATQGNEILEEFQKLKSRARE
jgi:hypothetical protein